jgi:hypothetical protein
VITLKFHATVSRTHILFRQILCDQERLSSKGSWQGFFRAVQSPRPETDNLLKKIAKSETLPGTELALRREYNAQANSCLGPLLSDSRSIGTM